MRFRQTLSKPIRVESGQSAGCAQHVVQCSGAQATRSVPFLFIQHCRKEAAVAKDPKVQQLERQLDWNSPGPLGDIAAASVDSALSITGQIVASLRRAAIDQPLTTLFLSFQAGYAVGRWGYRHGSR
jgi:hypothetical protein